MAPSNLSVWIFWKRIKSTSIVFRSNFVINNWLSPFCFIFWLSIVFQTENSFSVSCTKTFDRVILGEKISSKSKEKEKQIFFFIFQIVRLFAQIINLNNTQSIFSNNCLRSETVLVVHRENPSLHLINHFGISNRGFQAFRSKK